jgi:signal peptidase I
MVKRVIKKSGNKLFKTSVAAFWLWIISVLGFIFCIAIATSGFRGVIQSTAFGNSPIFLIVLFSCFIVGSIAFLVGILGLTTFLVLKRKIKHRLIKVLLFIGILAILPVYILITWFFQLLGFIKRKQINLRLAKKENLFKALNVSFIIVFLLPLWVLGYLTFGVLSSTFVMSELGYSSVVESIVGTGSMYPTFPKSSKSTLLEKRNDVVASASFISYPTGIILFGNRYFGRDLKRGDIITFENKKTDEVTKQMYGSPAGFLKRLIALPGDTLELRGGIVYLNKKPLKEPYTAKAMSTFAEQFLSECSVIKVPANKIFAMGDNRKGSGDSREIGFVDFKEIDHVLPIENQKGVLDKYWRDTSKDFDETSKIKIDKEKYMQLLNSKRKEANVQLLKYQPKLEESAKLRGEMILKFDDFSWEATRSGYTMYKAMSDANYYNITYGEAPTQGYFEADELIDNQFQFPETKKFLLDKDYQEIGLSEVEGQINGCPTQVIVQHFAGYIPPNYASDLISSWEKALSDLRSIQSGWQGLKQYSKVYDNNKNDVNRINDIISQRISMIEGIVAKMKANQWLTSEQDSYTRTTDKALSDEENSLADKLNKAN